MMTTFVIGCGQPAAPPETPGTIPQGTTAKANPRTADTEFEHTVRAFCADCHKMPRPQSFPKNAWKKEVKRGFDFYYAAGRKDLTVPSEPKVVSWFQRKAPHSLKLPTISTVEGPVVFEREPAHPGSLAVDLPPAISFVDQLHVSPDKRPFVMSDMRSGAIHIIGSFFGDRNLTIQSGGHPCAVRRYRDSNQEEFLLVADLGSFLPEDHSQGRLLSFPLQVISEPDDVTPVVLLDNIGRVADFCVEDFTGDGKPDIAVSEFGWQTTGGIHLLTNVDPDGKLNNFERSILDERSGAIQILPVDLNDDEQMDIVTVISQETEQVVALINTPTGFETKELYSAPGPSYGSSGITLSDIDGDGDSDIIYTNGDTFDSFLVKPFHSIKLLENLGGLRFRARQLTAMPGVHRALPADLDGDGDLDIAAVALLPKRTQEKIPKGKVLPAVCWLENVSGEFETHVITTDAAAHPSLWVGDIDGDSDIDLVAGRLLEEDSDHTHVADIFRNQGKR